MTRIPLALAALLAGCTARVPPLADGFVAIGQTATVGRVELTPLMLLEDSRCPQAVRCVWQGRVRLEARVNGGVRELTLGQPLPVAGGALMLAEVRPSREPEAVIAASDYRFRFSFTL